MNRLILLFVYHLLLCKNVYCSFDWRVRAQIAEANVLLAEEKLRVCLNHNKELEDEIVYAMAYQTTQSILDLSETNYQNESSVVEDRAAGRQ